MVEMLHGYIVKRLRRCRVRGRRRWASIRCSDVTVQPCNDVPKQPPNHASPPQHHRRLIPMPTTYVIANGQQVAARLPCSIEEFLLAQKLLPRSVVVEHNGEAVAPSEFPQRQLHAGDRLEIVRIVAGG